MSTDTLSWPVALPRRSWKTPPPMGQGLAVIVVVAAALLLATIGVGSYLVSLRIAGARAEAVRLEHRLVERRAALDALRREYEIRSRMSELDRWRGALDLQAVRSGQMIVRADAVPAAARMRRDMLASEAVAARPVDSPAHPGYPQAARATLDDLVGEVIAN